ncbi:hypothetical protein SEA_PUPPER_39 [Gordonia phage Pupper]|uniref:Uncharacterized protein n=1 Tax=Gordonia phage Pupper TaxID=2571249 RepID=A0A4Y6EIF9_9CAUD|nr:hypothetical protein KHQ83_gp039 [Gordonia phage Pupper]QDF18526.1 hypothetical protein SEA_PUPPER_39 [Gordonia phage Pupper]QDF18759.1 hypothetical protein SEA_SCENTAE_39 [Gordonia phage SCentae]
MTTKTGQRESAREALEKYGSAKGWIVRKGNFTNNRTTFQRGPFMLTADFHPGGSLKQASRYDQRIKGSGPVAELRKDDPKRRQIFEGWLREHPQTGATAATNELLVEYTPLPPQGSSCSLCGASVSNVDLHTSWHRELGR